MNSSLRLLTIVLIVAAVKLGLLAVTFTGIWSVGLLLKGIADRERLTAELSADHQPWMARQMSWMGPTAVVAWALTGTAIAGSVWAVRKDRKPAPMEEL